MSVTTEPTEEMADTDEAQLLSDVLGDIAREDAALGAAHLEARVIASSAAFLTARLKPGTTHPTARLTRGTTYLVVTAAIAVAVFVPRLLTRDVSKHRTEMQVEPFEQPITDIPRTVAETRVPMRPARRARPATPATPTMPTKPTIPESSLDEFMPLMPMTEQELTGSFQLVRVQMPRASLGALRSPLEPPNELIEADVLLGEDGMARAIRVSTSESVYPWRSR